MLDALLPDSEAGSLIVDLGAGAGRLAGAVAGLRPLACIVGIELCRGAVAIAPPAIRARMARGSFFALPLPDASATGFVSGLLSLNYAGTESRFLAALAEAARVACPGAVLIAELALAHEPSRLAGLAERAGDFAFLYHDVLESTPGGCSIRAQINIGAETSHFALFVPAVAALPAMFQRVGWRLEAFHAPHDLTTRALIPPPDCLRAVVLAHRE